MQFADMNWKQMETYLARDDRCILPLGCVEQHASLSLCVDAILAERMAIETAKPLGIPVCPVLAYSATPSHAAFPGTISIRLETFLGVVRDILTSLMNGGFRRVLIVNGHGGNSPAKVVAQEVLSAFPTHSIIFHNWWQAERTMEKALEIGINPNHANWFENFPWTRIEEQIPSTKPAIDEMHLEASSPVEARALLGNGSYGGLSQTADEDMLEMWLTAISETREILENGWPAYSRNHTENRG
ncbi:creatininase family protein [Parasphingorhabdus sp.]|uniref:creatininase family protein n=1 Tax=Parasphingorhabdus sp. TaxID=2709688 RepID=UPI003264FA63